MRKFTIACALILPILLVGISGATYAQTKIDQWGAIGSRLASSGWTLNIDDSTPAGDAYLTGPGTTNSSWTAIRGGFDEVVNLSVGEALVVRGTIEINGAFTSWNPIRMGVFNHTDIGNLENAGTDSAKWGYTQYAGTDSAAFVSNESGAYGYLISNQTGANGGIAGQGGNGNLWSINGGSWISTWSGGTQTLGETFQSPRRANMEVGSYDFEMSIELTSDTTSEIRWYIKHQDGKSYLHSGVHNEVFKYPGTDSSTVKTSFNGFAFSHEGNDNNADVTEVKLKGFEYEIGTPITIPEPIFSKFYISDWGTIGGNSSWTIDNDSSTYAGDGYASGEAPPEGAWMNIVGHFGGNVSATFEEALIVRGELEIIGDDVDTWSPFRFGVFNHTDIGELNYQYTDSARWGYTKYAGTDSATFVSREDGVYGYAFHPKTGAAVHVSGQGGNGTAWAINGGRFNSSWSGGTMTLGITEQSPRRAILAEGTYEFEISIQPRPDSTSEVRWYLIDEDGEKYLHSGIHIDTTGLKTEYNTFMFGIIDGMENELTGIKLMAVQVDRGEPIDIPLPIFSKFYVSDWGFLGGKFGGTSETDSAWTLTPGLLVGDVTIGGESAATGLAAVGGSFGIDVKAETDEALLATGVIKLTGGSLDDFHIGVFKADGFGSNDSTEKVGYVWNGTDTGTGYLFNTNGVTRISGDSWYNVANGTSIGAGTATGTSTDGEYEFSISIRPVDGKQEVQLLIEGDEFSYEVNLLDDAPETSVFNSIIFGTSNTSTTELALEEVEINLGAPLIDIEQDLVSGKPEVFALEQNYPNPFNPSTRIQFALPQTSNVTLEVYDMLGRKVATLINGEQMSAAFHTVNFDASALSSGMYIYRIEAGNFVSTKKMMLIK